MTNDTLRTEASLRDTNAFVDYVYAAQPFATPMTRLVQPSVDPRFIPTCSEALLRGLGDIAKKNKEKLCWVSKHCRLKKKEKVMLVLLLNGL